MEFSHLIRKLYEDDYLLVVEKPAGLVVDPADTVKEETLADILIRDFKINLPRGGIVHRLDKDTSGILLVAKTQAALENLQFQFKDRKTFYIPIIVDRGFIVLIKMERVHKVKVLDIGCCRLISHIYRMF